ncbi:MAG: rod shape-determining protein MreD [Proteobacteria bacterium]|nr:rod shape-determining protein MreD [Pseudomonadota bacterium]
MAKPQHILLPVRLGTITASFVIALLLHFLPWPDMRYVPDAVALVLVFWCVHQPRLVGLGIGWMLGLVVDAGNGVLLGQHALAYAILAFLAITLSRRILWFGSVQQALYVAALLGVAQGVTVLVRLVAGAGFPGWGIAVGPLVAAVLWPLVAWLLLQPQRTPVEPEGLK